MKMQIYCTGCQRPVSARLTDGSEVYPLRPDLESIPFWICDVCKAFVGTHHKTKERTKPLGYLASPEVKKWRMIIHSTLDPLWKSGKTSRGAAYMYIANKIGKPYHTGEIKSEEEGRQIYEIVKAFKMRLDPSPFDL